MTELIARVEELVASARRSGADAAEAMLVNGISLGVQVRHGQSEEIERSETKDLGLRVFVGKRSAIVSTTDLDPSLFPRLIDQAIAMANVVPEDRYGGLCEASVRGRVLRNTLDLTDSVEPDLAELTKRAASAEAAALAVPGVTNSGGGSAGYGRTTVSLAHSGGFSGSYARTSHSVSVSVLAGSGTAMQRDYDFDSRAHLADLDNPSVIGRSAGERAIARLNPVKPRTGRMPVVFDPRVSNSLLGHIAGALNGASIARGTSFLKTRMGTRILPRGLSIVDDPRRPRSGRSKPFDAEGVETETLFLVADGELRNWILDGRSGRQLDLPTNGHAARGPSSAPSPATTNLYLEGGVLPPETLIADIGEGVYLTEMMGNAVNGLTGDYSRGGAGFMIRNGVLAEPVAEFTVAGNLIEMLAELQAANDLSFRRGTDAPTVRIDTLTIAGS